MKPAYRPHGHMKSTTHLLPRAVCIHCVYLGFNTRAKSAASFYNKSENFFTQFKCGYCNCCVLPNSQMLTFMDMRVFLLPVSKEENYIKNPSPILRIWLRFLTFSRGRSFPCPLPRISLEAILCSPHPARSIIIS